MSKPCGHGEPVAGCRICFLADTDPRYQKLYGSAQISEPAPLAVCRHMTEKAISRGACGSCQVKWIYPCEVYGTASPEGYHVGGVKRCNGCVHHAPRNSEKAEPNVKRLLLANHQCPGDALVMSAAIESLHFTYPGEYVTAYEGVAKELFDHNPHVAEWREEIDGERVEWEPVRMQYPLVDQCDMRPVHFMQGYCDWLATVIRKPVPLMVNRPHVYLSPEERGWIPQVAETLGKRPKYWLVNAGYKDDYPAKWWGASNFQRVVDLLRGKVLFVQIGEAGHTHPPLAGVLDMRGKTDIRQLCRMVFHASGGFGPSTFLQHLCAAFEKPYVCLAGGREPLAWQHYPRQATLSTIGVTQCTKSRAGVSCWKDAARANPERPKQSVCELPVISSGGEVVTACLESIRPERVAEEILLRYNTGTSFA
jgi:hypothetical protein